MTPTPPKITGQIRRYERSGDLPVESPDHASFSADLISQRPQPFGNALSRPRPRGSDRLSPRGGCGPGGHEAGTRHLVTFPRRSQQVRPTYPCSADLPPSGIQSTAQVTSGRMAINRGHWQSMSIVLALSSGVNKRRAWRDAGLRVPLRVVTGFRCARARAHPQLRAARCPDRMTAAETDLASAPLRPTRRGLQTRRLPVPTGGTGLAVDVPPTPTSEVGALCGRQ